MEKKWSYVFMVFVILIIILIRRGFKNGL